MHEFEAICECSADVKYESFIWKAGTTGSYLHTERRKLQKLIGKHTGLWNNENCWKIQVHS